MKQLKDKTVLITGGASGIGKIMARLMLERRAKVIIWDINQAKIDETLSAFSSKGKISGYNVDISDNEKVKKTAETVRQEHGTVDILINNAGIVVGKYFHEHTKSDIDKTLAINVSAQMYITSEFLPDMMKQNSGHICNIASSAGIISNPKMSVYAASKWAVIGWSDSLRLEMQQLGKNIQVTTIMPYYINTGMFDGVRSKIPILDPEVVSLKIIQAIEKNKKMLTIPAWIYRTLKLGQAILSIRFFDWFVGGVLGIYKTMEHFTGHKNGE